MSDFFKKEQNCSDISTFTVEGVRTKRAFFMFRPSSKVQKGLSDIKNLLIPLACEILFK